MNDPKKLARMFQSLAVDTRVKMVQLLCKRALCVNALARQLGVTAAAASQHLRVLRDAGMVSSEKRGYYVHYYVEKNTARNLRAAVGCVIKPGPAGKRKRGSR